jgi:hypothetical protein
VSEPVPLAEPVRVRVMRYRRLRELGFTMVEARLLADTPDVDLHEAERLIRELGCPAAVAARILV